MPERTGLPAGSVRLVEPFGAGGGPDLLARQLAPRLSARWRQPVVVENVPGNGSTAAPALVAESPADGRTVLINTSAHAYIGAVSPDLPYHPLDDFTPVAPLTRQAYVFVTGRDSGIDTLGDLVDAAGARPTELTFGSTGAGTGSHVGAALLNLRAGVSAVHVPPGPGESIVDVVAKVARGVTDYFLSPIAIVRPYLDAGTLVALGVSTARRSPWLARVPTVAEQGITGFDFPIWYGAWVRAGTSADTVRALGKDLSDAMASPELEEWCTRHGAEPMRMATAEFSQFVTDESLRAVAIMQGSGNGVHSLDPLIEGHQPREVEMSTADINTEAAADSPPVKPGQMRLEVVVLAVSDVDRAKRFYETLGWRLDADLVVDDGYRVVQLTPPGSACSIIFGTGVTSAQPGSSEGLQLSVYDIGEARADLVARGIEVSEPFHDVTGIFHHAGKEGRLDGTAPGRADYGSFVSFADPDGNGWLLQEIKTRLPGR